MSYLSYIVEVESYRVSQNLFQIQVPKRKLFVIYSLYVCVLKLSVFITTDIQVFPLNKKIWFFPEICGLLEFRENCATLEKMLE